MTDQEPDTTPTVEAYGKLNAAYAYFNPAHFHARSPQEVLSTLVHEMVHLWQHHFGKPSRSGYHNREWAAKMEEVGLRPTDTGAADGKKTGQKMSHMILQGGAFAAGCAALMKEGVVIPYIEIAPDEAERRKKKAASKTKYACPDCEMNAWAKPQTQLVCGACMEAMLASEAPEKDAA